MNDLVVDGQHQLIDGARDVIHTGRGQSRLDVSVDGRRGEVPRTRSVLERIHELVQGGEVSVDVLVESLHDRRSVDVICEEARSAPWRCLRLPSEREVREREVRSEVADTQ